MELFSNDIDPTINLLPEDGTVHYYGKVFTAQQTDKYFDALLNGIEWKNDEVFMYGKLIVTKRKTAWYGDQNFEYSYSKKTKRALLWTKDLLELKTFVEEETNEQYNSCLLNLYHQGDEGMGWHSDAEKELKKDGAIASLSFGAERKFMFRHKQTKETISIMLENGSLLLMKDTTQSHWLHQLPPGNKITKARINLTFRTIVQ